MAINLYQGFNLHNIKYSYTTKLNYIRLIVYLIENISFLVNNTCCEISDLKSIMKPFTKKQSYE